MRLSRESRYAILALEELMSHDDDEIVDARSLARPAKLPEAFLQKILAMLVTAGILHSYRGRGYRLARPTVQITLVQILAAVVTTSSAANAASSGARSARSRIPVRCTSVGATCVPS